MVTLSLASMIGWYMIIFSLLLLCKHEYVRSITDNIMENKGLFFIVTVITVILGLLLVTSHNIWMIGWPVIITIFAWMVLISGLVRLFCPEIVHKIWRSSSYNRTTLNIMGVMFLVVGLYLLSHVNYLHC